MRSQYDDLLGLYEDAKLNENAVQMEKLSKATASLAKQIKDQEIHEKRVVSINEIRRVANLAGMIMSKRIKEYVDPSVANLIIEVITDEIAEVINGLEND